MDDEFNTILQTLKNKKLEIEKAINKLNKLIYDNETKYLEETSNGGNIFRGWEHVFTSKPKTQINPNTTKKPRIPSHERLFSQTDSTFQNKEENNNLLGLKVVINNNNQLNNNSNSYNNGQQRNNNNTNNNNSINHRHKKKINSLSFKKKKNSIMQKDKGIDLKE